MGSCLAFTWRSLPIICNRCRRRHLHDHCSQSSIRDVVVVIFICSAVIADFSRVVADVNVDVAGAVVIIIIIITAVVLRLLLHRLAVVAASIYIVLAMYY